MSKIEIFIATHKEYTMPQDEIYKPIFVGSAGKPDLVDYQRDDQGENISEKNASFCELTGLYWAWKNSDADYIGLAHYRRHFSDGKKIATKAFFENIVGEDTIIVPKKRKYYIETLYNHYSNSHYAEHLDKTRDIIEKKYPGYIESFDHVMKKTEGYMFNMLILPKSKMDAYCEWLFTILMELEKEIDTRNYDAFQSRLYGRVSELLLNVWIYQNKIEVLEVPWLYTEKINKLKKIKSFLKAKYLGKKYNSSF